MHLEWLQVLKHHKFNYPYREFIYLTFRFSNFVQYVHLNAVTEDKEEYGLTLSPGFLAGQERFFLCLVLVLYEAGLIWNKKTQPPLAAGQALPAGQLFQFVPLASAVGGKHEKNTTKLAQ